MDAKASNNEADDSSQNAASGRARSVRLYRKQEEHTETYKSPHYSDESGDEIDRLARDIWNWLRSKFQDAGPAEIATIVTNLGLVLIGIFAGTVYWKQLGTMQGQLDEMRLDQRAWVGAPKARLTECRPPNPRCKAEIEISNSGKTPALKLKRATGFLVSNVVSGPQPKDIALIENQLRSSRQQQALAPQAMSRIETADDGHYVFDHWSAIQAQTSFLIIFGKVEYSDTTGSPGSTVFCFYWAETSSNDLASCEDYNDMK